MRPMLACFSLAVMCVALASAAPTSCPYPASFSAPAPLWSLDCTSPSLSGGGALLSPSPHSGVGSILRVQGSLSHTGLDLMNAGDNPVVGGGAMPSQFNVANGVSIQLWVYLNAYTAAGGTRLFERASSDGTRLLQLVQDNAGAAGFSWRRDGTAACTIPPAALQILRWSAVGLTIDPSGSVKLYVDGVQVNSCTWPSLDAWVASRAVLPATPVADGWNVDVAHVDWWDAVMTAATMSALYATPPPAVSFRIQSVSSALYHHPFTSKLDGAPWFPAANGMGGVAAIAHYAHAVYHSTAVDSTAAGANTILPVTYIDPPMTISGWIYLLSYATYPDLLEMRYAWRENNQTYNRDRINVYIGNTGHISLVASWNTSTPSYYADTSVLELHVWHHVAVSISTSPSTLSFYLNGVQTASYGVPEPFIRYGADRNQAYTSNADGPAGQPHDSLLGTGVRLAQLVVHSTVLTPAQIQLLAISPPPSIVSSPLTIQIPTSSDLGAVISVPVYLPWLIPTHFPICTSPSWTLNTAAVTSTGAVVSVSPSSIVFDSSTTSSSFSLTFPVSLPVQWIDVSFTLSGLTGYVSLPFNSWRILQRTAPVLRAAALVDTQFSADPGSPHYTWAVGPSGALNTGIATLADYTRYVDLLSLSDLPGSSGVIPTTWGSSRPWHGHTIQTWLQWNGPWCQSSCGSAEIDFFLCQAADQSEMVYSFVAPGDMVNTPGLKYAGRFLPPPAPKYYASSDPLRLTGDWVQITVTTDAHGWTAFYLNGTMQGPANGDSEGFVRVATRPQCTLRTHSLGGSVATVSFWPRALTALEVAAVTATGRPLSICLAPCIYASALWGTFFDTAAVFAGHTQNPADPTPPSGYLSFITQVDPFAGANGGVNVPFELSMRDPLNLRHAGEFIIPDVFPSVATDAMEVLTLAIWVRFMDTSPAVLFDWRSTGGADTISLSRVAGGTLQYSAQVGTASPVSFAIPATVVVGQWLHCACVHNRTALTVYVNTVAYTGPQMPLIRRVSRPFASLHDTGLVQVASLHVFPLAWVRREVETIFSWKPDSIWMPPITLMNVPSSIAVGATITVTAALPLPWAIFPPGSPTTLTLLLDDCGTGSVSPTTLVFSGATTTASFTVRIPSGLARVTVKYTIAAGGASARYSPPPTSVFVPATGPALWGLATFGTFFPAAPTSSAPPAWSAGVSADSGIVAFSTPSQKIRLDLIGDVGVATAPQPLTLPVELGSGLSVAVSAMLSSSASSGVFWQLLNATTSFAFQISSGGGGIELVYGPVANPRRCVAIASLPTAVYTHYAFTLSAASIASLYLNGALVARCNFPFIDDFGASTATAGNFAQATSISSVHYFSTQLSDAEVALLAQQSAPSLLFVASASAAALRASADFGTMFSTQLSFAGWAPGPSGAAGTGIALTATWENDYSYIAYNVVPSAQTDMGAGATQWPVNFGARPGGFSVSSWHLLQRYSGYPQLWSCHSVSGGPGIYEFRVQFDAAGQPNRLVLAWSVNATGSTVYEITPVVPLVIGQWLHLTVVLSPCDLAGEPNVFMYFNGQLVMSFNVPGSVPVTDRVCTTEGFTSAAQAGMHVWKRMLSADEIMRLSRTPPPNIGPCALTIALDSMPSSLANGESTTVNVVLPLPVYMFAQSAGAPAVSNQYSFILLQSDGTAIGAPVDFVLSDSNPFASLNLAMPAGITDFITVWLQLRNGDLAHYISSKYTVYVRSPANVYAQATFASWFQAPIVASADLSQSPPPNSYLMLQNYYAMNWYNKDETGSTGVYPSVIGSGGFPAGSTDVGGFTIGVRFVGPTTVNSGCWSDLLNAGVTSGPLSRINLFRDQLATGFCLKLSVPTSALANRADTSTTNAYCCYNSNPAQFLVAGQQYHVLVTQTRYSKVKLYFNGAWVKDCTWLPTALSVPRAEVMSQAQCSPINYISHHYWPRTLTDAEITAAQTVTRYGVISLSSFPAQVRAGSPTSLTITLSGNVPTALDLQLQCVTYPAGGSIIDFSVPAAHFPVSTTGGQVIVTLQGNLASAPQGAHCLFSLVVTPTGQATYYDVPAAFDIEVLPPLQGFCAADDGHWTSSVPNEGAPYCAKAAPLGLNLTAKDFAISVWFEVKSMAPSSTRQVLLTVGENDDWHFPNQFMFVSLTPTATSGFATITLDWNGNQNLYSGAAYQVLGQWVHLVINVGSVAMNAGAAYQAFFVNGVHTDTRALGADLAISGPQSLFLGRYICGQALTPLSGSLDELRIWSTTLTQAQVTAGFQTNTWPSANLELWYPFSNAVEIGMGLVRDASPFGRNASFPNDIDVGNYELADGPCTTTAAQCPVATRSDGHVLLAAGGSNCAQIDTTGTELQLAYTDFTISFYVRRTQLAGGVVSTLLSYGNAPNSQFGYLQLGFSDQPAPHSGADRLWLSFGAIKDGLRVSSNLDLTVGDWVLMTLVVRSVAQHGTSASRTLYRNGIAWIDDQRMVDDLQAVGMLSIGAATSPGQNCVGGIATPHALDEMRIYNRALSVAELQAQWTTHPSAAGLVLHYPFTAGTSTPLILADDRAHSATGSALSATWLTQPAYETAHPLCTPARFIVVGTIETLIVGTTPTLNIAPSVVLPAGIGVQITVATVPSSAYTASFQLQFAAGAPGLVSQPITLPAIPTGPIQISLVPTGFLKYQLDSNTMTLPTRDPAPAAVLTLSVAPTLIYTSQFSVVSAAFSTPLAWANTSPDDSLVVIVTVSAGTLVSSDRMSFRSSLDSRSLLWLPPSTPQVVTFTFTPAPVNSTYALSTTTASVTVRALIGSPMCAAVGVNGQMSQDASAIVAPNCVSRSATPSLSFSSEDFSFSYWIFIRALPPPGQTVFAFTLGAVGSSLMLQSAWVRVDNDVVGAVYFYSPEDRATGSLRTPALGRWMSVTGVHQSPSLHGGVGSTKLYIDGDLRLWHQPTQELTASGNLVVGCYYDCTRCLTGSIDQLRFYRTAWTASDVAAALNSGTFSSTALQAFYSFPFAAGGPGIPDEAAGTYPLLGFNSSGVVWDPIDGVCGSVPIIPVNLSSCTPASGSGVAIGQQIVCSFYPAATVPVSILQLNALVGGDAGGSVVPASRMWGTPQAMTLQSFTITAAAPAGMLSLATAISGGAAPLYSAPVGSLTWTVSASTVMSVSCSPATGGSLYSLQSSSCWLSPNASPAGGPLNVSLSVVGGGSVSPAYLLFPAGVGSMQQWNFTAPLATGAVSVSMTAGGVAGPQFTAPSAAAWNVITRDSFTVACVGDWFLAYGETVQCDVNPSAPPAGPISLQFAIVTGTGSLSVSSRAWSASSVSVQSFTLTASASSGTTAVGFTVQGAGSAQFAAPTTVSWTVQAPTAMSVSCAPSSTLSFLQRSACWLQPNISPDAGSLEVNLTAVGGGSVVPASLTFVNGAALQFNYTAPVVVGAVSVAFSKGGSASAQFSLPVSGASWTVLDSAEAFVFASLPAVWYPNQTISLSISPTVSVPTGQSVTLSFTSPNASFLLSSSSLSWSDSDGTLSRQLVVQAPPLGNLLQWNVSVSGSATGYFSVSAISPFSFPLTPRGSFTVSPSPPPTNVRQGDTIVLSLTPAPAPSFSAALVSVTCSAELAASLPSLSFPVNLLTSRSLTLTATVNGTFECTFDSASFSAQFLPVPVWTVTVLPPAAPAPPQCIVPSAGSSTPCSSVAVCVEQPSVQFQRNFTCECPLGTGGFDCRLIPAADGPAAVLTAPALVAACDSIVLDARTSLRLSAAGLVRFGASSLLVSGVEQLNLYAASIGSYLFSASGVAVLNATTLSGAFSFGGSVLTIPASQLPATSVVEFWLQVAEVGGVWSVPSYARVTLIVPSSSPWMPNDMSISKPESILRTASATFSPKLAPACAKLPTDAVLSFQWIVAPLTSADLTATPPSNAVHTASSRDLVIPANTLQALSRYTVWLRLTIASTSGIAGRRLLATSDSMVRYTDLSVQASSLVAYIAGGSRSRVANATIMLDGRASMDPDTGDATGLTFGWTCVCASDPLVSCTLPLALSSSPSLTLPSGFFPQNQRYQIALLVTGSGGRNSTDSIELAVTAPSTGTPLVSIYHPSSVVNPNDAVVLVGRTVSTSSTPSYALRSVWSVTSAQVFDCSAPSNLLGPANAANLLLATNALAPGVWTFRLTVTDPSNGESAFAETTFTVRDPPSGGSCSLTPSSGGVALTDLFTLVCAGWSDPHLLVPLTYSSVLVAVDGSEHLFQPSSLLPYSSFLLAAGNLTIKTYITDTAGASTSVTQSVVVTPSPAMLADPICFALSQSSSLLAAALAQQDVPLVLSLTSQLADLLATAATSTSACSAASVSSLLVDALASVAPLATTCETKRLVAQSLESVSANPSLTATSLAQVETLLSTAISGLCAGDAAAALGGALSNLLSCSTLDNILALAQQLLSQGLIGGVSGQSLSVDTINFFASTTRSDVNAGATITLPSNISATITPGAMAAIAAALPQLTAANVDSATSVPSGQLDSRVVSFGPAFAGCHPTGNQLGLLGPSVSIDFLLNGQPLNVSSLLGPLSFVLPGDLSLASSCAIAECGWWDPAAHAWSTAGCSMLGATADGMGAQCECTHTTEFALLARNNDACAPPVSWQWLLFLILYSVLGFVALVQLVRILRASGCSNWLMCSEHALIVSICAARAVNQAVFYNLLPQLSFTGMALLSGIPYLFLSSIFSFVIVAWASLSAQANDASTHTNPFARYKRRFIVGNVAVSGTLFGLFAAMAVSSHEQVRVLSHVGECIVFALCLALATFFAIYGSKLVRTLTKDFKSPYAFKLGATAVSLSVAFLTSGLLLLYGVTNEAAYAAHFDLLNSLYFAMDLVGLAIILLLFRKSVNDADARADKTRGSRFFAKSGNRSVVTRQTILSAKEVYIDQEPAKPDPTQDDCSSSSDSDSDEEHSSGESDQSLGATATPVVDAAAAASAASALVAAPPVVSESGEDQAVAAVSSSPAASPALVPTVPTEAEAAAAAAAALLAHQWMIVDELEHHPEYKSGPAFSFKRTATLANRVQKMDKMRAVRTQMQEHLRKLSQGDSDAKLEAPANTHTTNSDSDTIQLPHSTQAVHIHASSSVASVAAAPDSSSFSPLASPSASVPFASPSMVSLGSPSMRGVAGRQRSYVQMHRSPSHPTASVEDSAVIGVARLSPLPSPVSGAGAAVPRDADDFSALPAPMLASPPVRTASIHSRLEAAAARSGVAGTGSAMAAAAGSSPPAAAAATPKPLYVRIHSNRRLTGSPSPLHSPGHARAPSGSPSRGPLQPHSPAGASALSLAPQSPAAAAAAAGSSRTAAGLSGSLLVGGALAGQAGIGAASASASASASAGPLARDAPFQFTRYERSASVQRQNQLRQQQLAQQMASQATPQARRASTQPTHPSSPSS